MSLQVWYDGELHGADDIRTGLLEQGLHYGTGVFEGIRAYSTERGPAIFRLADHMARMQRGADALNMTLDTDALAFAMGVLLEENGLSDAYIRPIAYYGGGKLHLDTTGHAVRHYVATIPWKSHLGAEAEDAGVRMFTSSYRKNSHRSIPPLKLCGGYVNAIIAKLEATRAGYDEALFQDDDGCVVEASAENVFLVRDGRVISCEHEDALKGITQDTIATIADAERRKVTLAELLDADEVFLTGTSAEVAPVTAIGERTFGIGPVTRALQATYQDVVHGRDRTHAAWLTWPTATLRRWRVA